MADIQKYLNEFLTLEDKQREELGIKDEQPIARNSNVTYKMQDEDFEIKDKKSELIQYATFYWLRLQSLKYQVKEAAELKWDEGSKLQYVNNNLDIKPGQLTVIIGTLFKEMALKPSILKNLQGVLGMRKFSKGLYVSDEDYAGLCLISNMFLSLISNIHSVYQRQYSSPQRGKEVKFKSKHPRRVMRVRK